MNLPDLGEWQGMRPSLVGVDGEVVLLLLLLPLLLLLLPLTDL